MGTSVTRLNPSYPVTYPLNYFLPAQFPHKCLILALFLLHTEWQPCIDLAIKKSTNFFLNPLQAFPLLWQLWEIIQKNGKLLGWGEAWKSVSLKRTSACKPHVFLFSSLTELPPFQKPLSSAAPFFREKKEEIGLSSHALTPISPKGQAKRDAQPKGPESGQHPITEPGEWNEGWGIEWTQLITSQMPLMPSFDQCGVCLHF